MICVFLLLTVICFLLHSFAHDYNFHMRPKQDPVLMAATPFQELPAPLAQVHCLSTNIMSYMHNTFGGRIASISQGFQKTIPASAAQAGDQNLNHPNSVNKPAVRQKALFRHERTSEALPSFSAGLQCLAVSKSHPGRRRRRPRHATPRPTKSPTARQEPGVALAGRDTPSATAHDC